MENASLITMLDDGLAGDRSAMEAFLVEAGSMLSCLIPRQASLLGIRLDDESTRDLTQDILLTLVRDDFRRLRSYKRQASLKTWLRVVATHTVIDHSRGRVYKKNRRTTSMQTPLTKDPQSLTVEDTVPDSGPVASETIDYRMRIALIREARDNCLDEENRLIIELWATHRTEKEIAVLLNMNQNTVATRIRRVKDAIRDYLNEKLAQCVHEEKV